jgi:hypothetical protein
MMDFLVTARITALSPGQSPPPVMIPTRFISLIPYFPHFGWISGYGLIPVTETLHWFTMVHLKITRKASDFQVVF